MKTASDLALPVNLMCGIQGNSDWERGEKARATEQVGHIMYKT